MPDQGSAAPRVWLLTGARAGDNNQLLALAQALGYPFEIKPLTYNQLRRLPFLRHGLAIVAAQSRKLIRPPWPDLVIGVGYASVPVARYIRNRSGGRTKIVHVGNPRGRASDFDLQITTPQYSRGRAPGLIELLFPIGNPAKTAEPTDEELQWLSAFPRPIRLVAVGGPARHWQLDHDALKDAVAKLAAREPGGSVIVSTSARTDSDTLRLLEHQLAGPRQALVERFPRFATLLRESDEIYVTADSVSMISEAILSGKRMGIIPIKRSLRGLLTLWLWERPFGQATFPNFENFWRLLGDARLGGTVDLPVASQVCDTVERAADAVRALLSAGNDSDQAKPRPCPPDLGDDRRTRRRQRSGDRARRGSRAAVRGEAPRI